MTKALILLIFLISIVAHSEDIRKDFEITNATYTFYFFKNYSSLIREWNKQNPYDYEDPSADDHLQGFSNCFVNPEKNISYCEIYALTPTVVDGENTLTIGHEVVHGIYGAEYHK